MKKIALILAGGSGKRFWPLSEKGKPKQLISLFSEKTLIEETIDRLLKNFKLKDIKIVTNKELGEKLKKLLIDFPEENILSEPQARNTAPSILWAISLFEKEDEETIFGIFPSDHFIVDEKRFSERLSFAFELADSEEKLITFGIIPTAPDTGYGYIETEKTGSDETNYLKVLSFKEKPNYKTAVKYLKEGNYFWNSGMFIWKDKIFRENLKKYSEYFFEYYEKFRDGKSPEKLFSEIKATSIDYALMEKSEEILLVKGDFRWSDVGSYKSFYDINKKDENFNVKIGNAIIKNSKSCLIYSKENPVALIGVNNIFVIVNNGKIVVGDMNHSQDVKEAYEIFEK
jgi:mannose-1-phosphate guanylyltransferase